MFRLSILEDGGEVYNLHPLGLHDAEHGQDRGCDVVGRGVVVAPVARSLTLGVAHHEDGVGELGVERPAGLARGVVSAATPAVPVPATFRKSILVNRSCNLRSKTDT